MFTFFCLFLHVFNMCWVFHLRIKTIFLIMDILFLDCGLEHFSLGNLVPIWLLEDPTAKEGAKERLWRMARGTIPWAIKGFWIPFCGTSSEWLYQHKLTLKNINLKKLSKEFTKMGIRKNSSCAHHHRHFSINEQCESCSRWANGVWTFFSHSVTKELT